jgi:hypothetical protein
MLEKIQNTILSLPSLGHLSTSKKILKATWDDGESYVPQTTMAHSIPELSIKLREQGCEDQWVDIEDENNNIIATMRMT